MDGPGRILRTRTTLESKRSSPARMPMEVHGQPQHVKLNQGHPDHLIHSRSLAAHSPAPCTDQWMFIAVAPRRSSMRMSPQRPERQLPARRIRRSFIHLCERRWHRVARSPEAPFAHQVGVGPVRHCNRSHRRARLRTLAQYLGLQISTVFAPCCALQHASLCADEASVGGCHEKNARRDHPWLACAPGSHV